MDAKRDSAMPRAPGPDAQSAHLAKAALLRLAVHKLEPTPENYAMAYQLEAGAVTPRVLPEKAQRLVERLAARAFDTAGAGAAQATALAQALGEGRWDAAEVLLAAPDESGARLSGLIDRVVRGVERGGRQWTQARKKESLQRVLDGSRGDAGRLQQRLGQLLGSWDSDTLDDRFDADLEPTALVPVAVALADAGVARSSDDATGTTPAQVLAAWGQVAGTLSGTVEHAMPTAPAEGSGLAQEIAQLTARIQDRGATPALADELAVLCERADLVLRHRHHLIDQLGGLCGELTNSLSELAENGSWAKGQCDAMRRTLDDGLTARSVKSVGELLRTTRQRQGQLRVEREHARDAMKSLIKRMLSELDELGSQTGRFHDSVGRYADVIERADSLESLASVVRQMVEESRAVQSLMSQTQQRMNDEHRRAADLSQRVSELEGELHRLAEEVSTDQLTQIANRRGLLQAFDVERSRAARDGSTLCVGLLDIDNFKLLNDELGHGVGDQALKSLAAIVSKTLRPTDLVARYGGEEFVVLLPHTLLNEALQVLSRLQRSLTGGLFMHEQKQVFVTFSAGVTMHRVGEHIEVALERADQALYEAKRTGKNRTCMG